MKEEEVDFTDPAFWERYQMYSNTRGAQLSAAEISGEVQLMSHDFTDLHQREFERETEEKAQLPIYGPNTAWVFSHLAWPLGDIYLGKGRRAFSRLVLQLLLISIILALIWLIWDPFYTDAFARSFHGVKEYEDMIKEDPKFFDHRREMIAQLSTIALICIGGLYLLLQFRFASNVAKEAMDSNMSLGLITEISHDLKFDINLGSLHGIKPSTRMIVEKRSFKAVYDDSTGSETMVNSFGRIGRCEILEIFESSTYCSYHPDKGRIVIPKVGDRITVLHD